MQYQIRLADPSDYPSFVRGIARWRVRWGIEVLDEHKGQTKRLKGDMLDWLMDNVDGERYVLYVAVVDGEVIGALGGEIRHMLLPPYYKCVCEWVWWVEPGYSKQVDAKLWRAVKEWGIHRGARYSQRAVLKTAKKGWTELHTFRRV